MTQTNKTVFLKHKLKISLPRLAVARSNVEPVNNVGSELLLAGKPVRAHAEGGIEHDQNIDSFLDTLLL